MGAVQGSKREIKEFIKETGFFEVEVICVNPDREKLEKLLGTQIEKDPEYLGEDDKGVTKLNLVIWVRDVETKKIRSIRFFLRDEVVTNDKGKTQYINSIGDTTWADSEENIQEWFKKREYRVARDGEEELYNFIKSWLHELDMRKEDTKLSFDWNKLMRGNVREISEQIGGEFDKTVVCLSTVKVVQKDGEKKEYEQVYNRNFLPGFVMKEIRLKKIDTAYIDAAEKTDKKKRSKLQKFVLNSIDKKYGVKEHFTLTPLQPYNPDNNPASSDKSHIKEDDMSY
jgi:hypothetical protein